MNNYLIVTDRGCYSDYGIQVYRCTEEEAKKLQKLSKQISARIRRKDYPDYWCGEFPEYYKNRERAAQTYLSYKHEDIRLIQKVDGPALFDDLGGGDVSELMEEYEKAVVTS